MTNVAKKTVEPKPTLRFYLADDFIEHVGGKITAVGLYADYVVVANMPADHPDPSEEAPVGFEGFGFLVSISGLRGAHTVSFGFDGPANEKAARVSPEHQVTFVDERQSANILARLRPYLTASFGMKRVTVTVDGKKHYFYFEIRRSENLISKKVGSVKPKRGMEKALRGTANTSK